MLQYANPRSFVAHNHNPDVDAIEVATLKATLKERAVVGDVQPARLLAGALLNASDAAKDRVKMQTARRSIRRFKQGMVPPEPATRRQLDFVGPWTTTGGDDPKPFLRHDSGQNARDRVVVFATDDSLRVLCRANTWYMDGNFSLAPPVFDQLYVIRAPLGTTCISCVYALLPGKTEAVYTQMLEAVTDACTALGFTADPTTVVTDFEMAAMHAVTAVFGQQVHVQGCFFHLCQSTWRHVQDLGLTALYNADDVAKHFVGMLDGLALLPLADVPAGMAHLRANTPQHLDDVINYFDATYVTGRHRVVQPPAANVAAPLPPARIRRQPPLFAPDVWNVHVATVTGADRTNNMCETWNSAFQRLVGHQHPGVWTLLRCLRKDAALVSTLIVQESRGMPPRKRQKRVYIDLQARLKYLCDARAAGTKTVEEMLDGVGHLIRF